MGLVRNIDFASIEKKTFLLLLFIDKIRIQISFPTCFTQKKKKKNFEDSVQFKQNGQNPPKNCRLGSISTTFTIRHWIPL